jgi:hypothetical protein
MGPILLRHPAATLEVTSPKKNRDATYPKALTAPTQFRIEARPRNDSQVGYPAWPYLFQLDDDSAHNRK